MLINHVESCWKILGDLYDFYASVYNPACDMSKHGSVTVYPTRFHLVIANIISKDDSFIGTSSTSPSSSPYVGIDNYL